MEQRLQDLRNQMEQQRCHDCGSHKVASAIQSPGAANEYESFRCRPCADRYHAQCYHDMVVREGHIEITDAIRVVAEGVAALRVTDKKYTLGDLWTTVELEVRARPPRRNWRNQPQNDVVRLTVTGTTILAEYYAPRALRPSQIFRVPATGDDYPRKVIDRLLDLFDGLR